MGWMFQYTNASDFFTILDTIDRLLMKNNLFNNTNKSWQYWIFNLKTKGGKYIIYMGTVNVIIFSISWMLSDHV